MNWILANLVINEPMSASKPSFFAATSVIKTEKGMPRCYRLCWCYFLPSMYCMAAVKLSAFVLLAFNWFKSATQVMLSKLSRPKMRVFAIDRFVCCVGRSFVAQGQYPSRRCSFHRYTGFCAHLMNSTGWKSLLIRSLLLISVGSLYCLKILSTSSFLRRSLWYSRPWSSRASLVGWSRWYYPLHSWARLPLCLGWNDGL